MFGMFDATVVSGRGLLQCPGVGSPLANADTDQSLDSGTQIIIRLCSSKHQ